MLLLPKKTAVQYGTSPSFKTWRIVTIQLVTWLCHTAGHVVIPYSWSRGNAFTAGNVVKPYSWSRGCIMQLSWLNHAAVTWLCHMACKRAHTYTLTHTYTAYMYRRAQHKHNTYNMNACACTHTNTHTYTHTHTRTYTYTIRLSSAASGSAYFSDFECLKNLGCALSSHIGTACGPVGLVVFQVG